MNIFFATNNSDMGGGEVMLLNLARATRSLGHQVTIIAQVQPDELIEAAKDEGFTTLALPATNRKAYMAQLRAWRRCNPQGLLWCNGLVPSLATAGMKNRLVHLHQLPQNKFQQVSSRLARQKALATLVPSRYMQEQIPGSRVLENWVGEVKLPQRKPLNSGEISVGFLGRVSEIKGTHVLAAAIASLNRAGKTHYKLVLGGSARFVDQKTQGRVAQALEGLGQNCVQLGWVSQEEFFSQVDCVVMPSLWQEPFGLVAAEAMSARVPLLVSKSGALPDIVGENYPWVFDQNNISALEQALEEFSMLLGRAKDLDALMTSSYWRWYENYSPQAGKERVKTLLDSLEGQEN